MPTTYPNEGHGAWLAMFGVFWVLWLLFICAAVILCIVCYWRIASKAGYSGILSLLMLVPLVNLVMLIFFCVHRVAYRAATALPRRHGRRASWNLCHADLKRKATERWLF